MCSIIAKIGRKEEAEQGKEKNIMISGDYNVNGSLFQKRKYEHD